MSIQPTRRSFVSGILSALGILAGSGRTVQAAEAVVKPVIPPVPIKPPVVRSYDPLPYATTFVYDGGGGLIRTDPPSSMAE